MGCNDVCSLLMVGNLGVVAAEVVKGCEQPHIDIPLLCAPPRQRHDIGGTEWRMGDVRVNESNLTQVGM